MNYEQDKIMEFHWADLYAQKFRQKFSTKAFQKAPVMNCGLWEKLRAEKAAKTAKTVSAQASTPKDKDLISRFIETRGSDVDSEIMDISASQIALHNQLKKSRELGEEINIVDLLS